MMDGGKEEELSGQGQEPSESLALLFAVGLRALAARRARVALTMARMIAMGALGLGAAIGSASVAMMAGTAALGVGAGPQLALLILASRPDAARERVLALGAMGLASWALIPLIVKGCGWIARKKGAAPLSSAAMAQVNATQWPWLKKSVQSWHEGGNALIKELSDSADQAVISKGAWLPMARLLAELALAPAGVVLLALCVGPWAGARALEWGLEAARGALNGVKSGASRLAGLASPSSADAAREWARKKAWEIAREGAGTEAAARAQKAALEKEIGPGSPATKSASRL